MNIKDQLIAIMDGECNIDAEIDQTKYPKPPWASHQIMRASGLIENICTEHGVGHPHEVSLRELDPTGAMGLSIHGCCGCCRK